MTTVRAMRGVLICPICHDESKVDGFKVCTDSEKNLWWHRCCKKDHGAYVLDGKEHQWPEYPYFRNNTVSTKHGNVIINYQLNV